MEERVTFGLGVQGAPAVGEAVRVAVDINYNTSDTTFTEAFFTANVITEYGGVQSSSLALRPKHGVKTIRKAITAIEGAQDITQIRKGITGLAIYPHPFLDISFSKTDDGTITIPYSIALDKLIEPGTYLLTNKSDCPIIEVLTKSSDDELITLKVTFVGHLDDQGVLNYGCKGVITDFTVTEVNANNRFNTINIQQ